MNVTNSKPEILKALRDHDIQQLEQPSLCGEWISYTNPRDQFVQVLEIIGGKCVFVPNEAAIDAVVSSHQEFETAKRIYSAIDGIARSNVDLAAIDDPHELEDVDYAILRGQLCVAENGSIWVTDELLPHRVIYFIVQHLALVVAAKSIVSNMHEAYEKLQIPKPGFGTFISGPSKTADIEQSLVIGAHGPRSLTVFLVG